jgi:hypothetical protein
VPDRSAAGELGEGGQGGQGHPDSTQGGARAGRASGGHAPTLERGRALAIVATTHLAPRSGPEYRGGEP